MSANKKQEKMKDREEELIQQIAEKQREMNILSGEADRLFLQRVISEGDRGIHQKPMYSIRVMTASNSREVFIGSKDDLIEFIHQVSQPAPIA